MVSFAFHGKTGGQNLMKLNINLTDIPRNNIGLLIFIFIAPFQDGGHFYGVITAESWKFGLFNTSQ